MDVIENAAEAAGGVIQEQQAEEEAAEVAVAASHMRRQRTFHPFCLLVHKPEPSDWVDETSEWLVDEATNGFRFCTSKHGNKRNCDCFSVFKDKSVAEAVADYLYFFGTTTPAEKDRIIMDILRYQENVTPPRGFESYRHYKFPYILSSDDDDDKVIMKTLQQHYVCISALQHLFGYGRKKFNQIRSDIKNGLVLPRRPRIGKESNRALSMENEGIMDDLRNFFEELCDLEEPRATRFVREATGVSVRDDSDTVDLPAYFSKRGLYKQFCFHRGIQVTTTNKGKPVLIDRDDEAWKEGGLETLKCPSWTMFCKFWERRYPLLKIQRPTQDICGVCYFLFVENKSQLAKKADEDATTVLDRTKIV